MSDEQNMQVSDGANGDRVVKVNFPPNSNSKKNYQGEASSDKKTETGKERKKVERVTTGQAKERKKGLGRKIVETFAGGDSMHSVGESVLLDVAVPAIKALISDMAVQAVERALFGETRRGSRPALGTTRNTNYTSYNNYSRSPAGRAGESDGPRSLSSRARASHDFKEITLENRGEAEEVLERLGDLINSYNFATVADFYELTGITGGYTDEKWGWYDIRESGVRRVREGYLIMLPPTQPID